MSWKLDPAPLFDLIARQVPSHLHENLLIVGSLAAAYHFRSRLNGAGVNTKDADIIIYPAGAMAECKEIAEGLLAHGWRPHPKCYPNPRPDPAEALRAVRLYPPDADFYFVELLAFPDRCQTSLKTWVPLELADGWYGMPSFRFLGLTGFSVQTSDEGLRYAAPSMMALSNLLAHQNSGRIG